jgi:hypothetical protein
LPLLLAAGIKAFPTAIAVRYRGQFVGDLLPSVIEEIAKTPEDYALDVVGLTHAEVTYLRGVLGLFRTGINQNLEEGDLLRECMDAVVAWRHALPSAVSGSRFLSKAARAFEEQLSTPDPVQLFLREAPKLVGADTDQPEELLAGVERLKDELESIETRFEGEAVEALKQTLMARGIRNGKGVRGQAARWARHFPKSFGKRLPDRVTQGVLSRLRAPYRDDSTLVNALATLLVGRPIRQWDDTIVPSFRRQLRSALEVIEGTALGLIQAPDIEPELRDGLIALAEAKAATIAAQLAEIVGPEQAANRLAQIAEELRAPPIAEDE